MTNWKTLTRATLCGAYKYSGAMWLHESVARCTGQQFMTILLFHRVTDVIPQDCLTVSTARFRTICRMLKRRFRVVPLGEIFRILRTGQPMPRRTVAITFDDSYRDMLNAARILHEHQLPATFFIPTAYVNSDRTFDWDRGLPRMPNLTWDEVREMAKLGFEIGSHTITHANLGVLGPTEARTEIFQSKQVLENELQHPIRWFAYPFGGQHHLRPEYLSLIHEAGYEGTVSAFGGFIRPGIDVRVLPREAVPYFRSTLHLELHLAGIMHWLYALKGRTPQDSMRTPWLDKESGSEELIGKSSGSSLTASRTET